VSDRDCLIEQQTILEALLRTGRLGVVELPNYVVEIRFFEIVDDPMLLDQISNMDLPSPASGPLRRPLSRAELREHHRGSDCKQERRFREHDRLIATRDVAEGRRDTLGRA
jgi:hypothetical protein